MPKYLPFSFRGNEGLPHTYGVKYISFFVHVVLRIEFRVLCMIGKGFSTEMYLQPLSSSPSSLVVVKNNLFIMFICMSYVSRCSSATVSRSWLAHVWRSELVGLGSLFPHVGSGDQTRVVRLGSKHLTL